MLCERLILLDLDEERLRREVSEATRDSIPIPIPNYWREHLQYHRDGSRSGMERLEIC